MRENEQTLGGTRKEGETERENHQQEGILGSSGSEGGSLEVTIHCLLNQVSKTLYCTAKVHVYDNLRIPLQPFLNFTENLIFMGSFVIRVIVLQDFCSLNWKAAHGNQDDWFSGLGEIVIVGS